MAGSRKKKPTKHNIVNMIKYLKIGKKYETDHRIRKGIFNQLLLDWVNSNIFLFVSPVNRSVRDFATGWS